MADFRAIVEREGSGQWREFLGCSGTLYCPEQKPGHRKLAKEMLLMSNANGSGRCRLKIGSG
jgi:hypothetical protein